MSNLTARIANRRTYMECSQGEMLISSEGDITDLFGLSYEHNTSLFLFYENNFHPDLFDLKTGLAGAVFQKIAVYHAKAAVILDSGSKKNKRFEEFMFECNKGNQVRFFKERGKAVEWLVATE